MTTFAVTVIHIAAAFAFCLAITAAWCRTRTWKNRARLIERRCEDAILRADRCRNHDKETDR